MKSLRDRLRQSLNRTAAFLRSAPIEDELDAEIASHLELAIEENLRRGLSPEEARRQALIRFGGVQQAKERHREARSLPEIDSFLKDLRYALRVLKKSPVFTAVAVLTLGFGIGLNTTLFSVVNTVALKPLPVRGADKTVRLERWFTNNLQGAIQYAFSYPEFRYFADHNKVFSSLIATSFPQAVGASLPVGNSAAKLARGLSTGPPENATVQMVSANYFAELGVVPVLGQTFHPEEDQAQGADPVVVLSYPYWQTRFNADPLVLGKVLKINDTALTIIGVTPREFLGTGNPPVLADFWTPLAMQPQILPGQNWLNQPLDFQIQLLGRLLPAADLKQAGADLSVLEQRFAQDHPNLENSILAGPFGQSTKTTAITVQRATFFGNTEDPRFKAIVALLMTIVAMVLVIACANLANMLLAKSSGRQREIAVRLALGASRGRLVRQLLTESVLLAIFGGATGVLFSLWGTRLLWLAVAQFAGSHASFITAMGPDARVLTYTLLLSLCTGLLFGLSPALQSSRPNLNTSLSDSATTLGQRLDRWGLRSLLVAAQVAVSTLFLISAGLLAHGLIRSQSANVGFEVRSVYPMALIHSSDPAKSNVLRQQQLDRLETLPQIQSVALVDFVPLGGTWTAPVKLVDNKAAAASAPNTTLARHISSSFLPALGIRVVRGRNFSREEARSGVPLAIVSTAMARSAWPNEDPIGKKFELETQRIPVQWSQFEVVGVAADVRSANITRVDPAMVYLPTSADKLYNYFVLLRIPGDPHEAMAAIRSTLEQLDGHPRPGFSLTSLEGGVVQTQILMAKTFTFSATVLAIMALLLASIGVYGVMAFLASQREKEVGIHLALGATRRDVLLLMLSQGMRPVIVGGTIGFVGALAISGLMRSLLVFPGSVDILSGAHWFDPMTFIGLSCLLATIALIACYLPARRVTQIDPLAALRHE